MNDGEETLELPKSRYTITSGGTIPPIAPHGRQVSIAELEPAPPLPPTRPYFSRPNIEQPVYDLSDSTLRNAAATPFPFVDSETLVDQGVSIDLKAVVTYSSGSQENNAVVVVPPVSISMLPSVSVDTPLTESISIKAITRVQPDDSAWTIHHYPTEPTPPKSLSGTLQLTAPDGWQAKPSVTRWSGPAGPNTFTDTFKVAPRNSGAKSTGGISATASYDGHDYSEGYRPVGYPGLTYTNYYTPATTRIVPVDVHTAPSLNIAYLPGTGDDLPAALEDLGIHARTLTLADLNPATLNQYDAVILGVRAYAAHPELAGPGSRDLLDYASNGGVVLIQYMTARFGDAEAPYPISVSARPRAQRRRRGPARHPPRARLAAAHLAQPHHLRRLRPLDRRARPRLRRIWAPQFTPLLEVHDPGQPPQQGGLLVAHTGKGLYIYCALALYRQLPEGVPGAYRLLRQPHLRRQKPRAAIRTRTIALHRPLRIPLTELMQPNRIADVRRLMPRQQPFAHYGCHRRHACGADGVVTAILIMSIGKIWPLI